MGASDDLSKIYFVVGLGAATGSKLFLYDEGSTKMIASLAPLDMGGEGFAGPSAAATSPLLRASRVSPDGSVAAFQSVASLTGYDNHDAANGEAVVEVYVYDANSDELQCVSCKPSGARPLGQPLQQAFGAREDEPVTNGPRRIWTAAWLTTARQITYTPRNLSDDGGRLFFNAFDALVPQDTNGQQDVYEWEAQGVGHCADAGGCLSLISSGKGRKKSEFVDATPGGRDVFFSTESSLVPKDPRPDRYLRCTRRWRLPPPPPGPPTCIGDACQSVPAAPSASKPASASFKGAGNPTPRSVRNCGARGKRAASLSRRAKHLRRRARHLQSTRKAKLLRNRSARFAKRARGLSKQARRCRRANRRAKR